MRVLLVENDGGTAHGTSSALRAIGYALDHVATGHEAVEMLRRYDYDLALLEMVLPDIDGYEVLRATRAARRETPIVALSSLGGPQAKVRAFSAGADDYITKPYDRRELAARPNPVVGPPVQGILPADPACRTVAAVAGQPRGDGERAARPPDRQGIPGPGTAAAAQGNGPDQIRLPRPSLWRHGRAGDEDHRRLHLQGAQETAAGGGRVADRHGLGPGLHASGGRGRGPHDGTQAGRRLGGAFGRLTSQGGAMGKKNAGSEDPARYRDGSICDAPIALFVWHGRGTKNMI
ncbi:putative response regulator protein [Gluconacetobacter diazotrophicus PA1 5]|uniref:Putative response regulator protein n=1 Tax=Gluconacetobacter diazotrophicus (strain ATCC 49037 / DSM 5601 / CCUG 37298 / CIP 103539 / LMG 7603 / PAl5) TaxID=272568 RepID=A9HB28_GLUDA|nr:putative response regulator protein [Gluconacetobacter diazotrophicus PA1 5]